MIAPAAPEAVSDRRRQLVRQFKDNNSVLILLLFLVAGFAFVDGFGKNVSNIIYYSSVYGLSALGLGLIMITGEIDLSAGFQAGFAGVFSVLSFNMVYNATGNSVLSLIVCIIGAVVMGGLMGVLNGFIVTKLGISSLIGTIAINYAYKGLVFYWANSSFKPEDADIVKLIAKTKIFGWKWLTPAFLIFIALVVVVFLWMRYTRFGNRLHPVGDNPEAAAYAGISTTNTKWVAYILSGVLAGVCGFFMVSNAGYAIYGQGNSLETFIISCCVIGGIKMQGGKGTAIHVLIGILIMRSIQQIMSCLFLAADVVNFITGVLLILVLVIDRFTSNKSADD